jgi:peptidyl-tRNA hydrolase
MSDEIDIPIYFEEPVEEDPIVMYLIVREDLGMSLGKTCAQISHATKLLLLEYFKISVFQAALSKRPDADKIITHAREEHVAMINKWLAHRSTTITKRADKKEWEKIKQLFDKNCFVVKDAGLTEIAPGSETVISLWPMHRSHTPKLIWRLRNL